MRPHARVLRAILIASLGAAALVTFGRVLGADFVRWDDNIAIYQNARLGGLSLDRLRWAFTDVETTQRYVPLSLLSWVITYQLWGLDPLGYHLGNLLLHAANIVLVFLFVERVLLLSREGLARAPGSAPAWRTMAAAAVGAAAWGLHPLRVEPVAWCTDRTYDQALFFTLLAALAWLRARTLDGGSGRAKLAYGWSVVAYGLALLSHPVGIMLPAVLLILDVYPLRRTSRFNRPHCVAVMLDKVPLAIMAAIVLGLTVWARHQSTAAFTRPATLEEFGIVERLAQAAYLWLYYGWRALWPVHLSPIYTTLIDFAPLEWPFLASMVSVPLITTALIAMRRRWPGALALWLAHVVILVPVLGWTEHPHYPSDRYALLANITWAVAAAGALWSLRARRRGFLFAVAAGLIVVASLAVMSWRQTAIWRDSESLFTHAAEMLDGHRMQSDMLVRLGLTRAMEGQWLLAAHDFARAARANPAYALPQLRLGEYLAAHGLMQAASDEWQRLLAAHPDDDAVRRAAAFVLYGGEQPDAAILILTNGLKRNPGSLDLRFSLGVILSATGRPAEGMREFRTILELDPDHTGAAWAIERLQSR